MQHNYDFVQISIMCINYFRIIEGLECDDAAAKWKKIVRGFKEKFLKKEDLEWLDFISLFQPA